jgi:hypothetical protein
VHYDFYEEKLDWGLASLIPEDLQVERVRALPTRPLRIVGDVGIRGFVPMLQRIVSLVDRSHPDFLYITLPSFYAALLGPIVHALRGVPYGLDYIDPWVHTWPGSEAPISKHWISRKLGELLEPIAVGSATLITGVAEGYFRDVLRRNPGLEGRVVTAAMPYGGDSADHDKVKELGLRPYLFDPLDGRFHLIYAGALLPRAFGPLECILNAVAAERETFEDVCFHFVGTGKSPDDHSAFNVRRLAEHLGLWGTVVTEHPARIPYLDTLAHVEASDAVLILGSTEPHYTPSKVYQAVLARRPVFAVLHRQSTGCDVITKTGAGRVLAFDGETDVSVIEKEFTGQFNAFRETVGVFDPGSVDHERFQAFSARNSARVLAEALDRALERAASRVSDG